MKNAMILGLASLLLTACGMTYTPQSAMELRQAGSESKGFYKEESLTINRSSGDIANTLRDKSKLCLNGKRVERTGYVSRGGVETQGSTFIVDFTSTLHTGSKGTELVVRAKASGDFIRIGEEPKGGSYMSIIDVTPIDKAHSKVDIYYHTRMATLFSGTKGWVTGADLTCPNLAKDYQM